MSQGYIQVKHMGLVLRTQMRYRNISCKMYLPKTAFAKIDVHTQKEIQGATMTFVLAPSWIARGIH